MSLPETANRLTVALGVPLAPENVELLLQLEPRIDLVDAIDSTEALFGVPGRSPESLGRAVASNSHLRWVHTIPAGGGQQIRAAQLDEAALGRIRFTTSAGVHAEQLAEFAVFGVLAGMKYLPSLQDAQRRHQWGPHRAMRSAADSTVAVVGLGSIGRATAGKLADLGFDVIGVHRREVVVRGVSRVVPIDDLARVSAECDAMVVALPSTVLTESIVSRAVLEAAKPGLTFVNVGRGSTIDEVALLDALREGRVSFAALDVFRTEPLPDHHEFWDLPNVLISPHTAAFTAHESRRITELFAENARRLLDGEPLLNQVNTVEFY
jgi:phosphoglycerate dehydrogenase-like enzyme